MPKLVDSGKQFNVPDKKPASVMSVAEESGKPKSACDDEIPDFSTDEDLLRYINPNRFIVIDYKGFRTCHANWFIRLLASVLVGYWIDNGEDASVNFSKWQPCLTQNKTWLYIGTQDVWAVFLLWLCFSNYGTIKLGKKDDKLKYGNLSGFAMLFACGIGIGLYYCGVSEPMNDDQRAQQALQGWCPYIAVAIFFGLTFFRQDRPLSMRFCFLPLAGEKVMLGIVGHLIDALFICCTTFGVCTSLSQGVESTLAGMKRLDSGDVNPDSTDDKSLVSLVITCRAIMFVPSGLEAIVPKDRKSVRRLEDEKSGKTLKEVIDLDNGDFDKGDDKQPQKAVSPEDQEDAQNALDDILYNLGMRDAGFPAAAASVLHRALLLRLGDANAHAGLGGSLLVFGRPQEVDKSLCKSLSPGGHVVDAYCKLAQALHATGEFGAAIETVSSGLDLDGTSPDLHCLLGASFTGLELLSPAGVRPVGTPSALSTTFSGGSGGGDLAVRLAVFSLKAQPNQDAVSALHTVLGYLSCTPPEAQGTAALDGGRLDTLLDGSLDSGEVVESKALADLPGAGPALKHDDGDESESFKAAHKLSEFSLTRLAGELAPSALNPSADILGRGVGSSTGGAGGGDGSSGGFSTASTWPASSAASFSFDDSSSLANGSTVTTNGGRGGRGGAKQSTSKVAAARPEGPSRHAAHGHALLELSREQDKDSSSGGDKGGLQSAAVGAQEKAMQLGPAVASTASLSLDELGEVTTVNACDGDEKMSGCHGGV